MLHEVKKQADERLVKIIEELLAQAKAGDMNSFLFIAGSPGQLMTGLIGFEDPKALTEAVGQLELIKLQCLDIIMSQGHMESE